MTQTESLRTMDFFPSSVDWLEIFFEETSSGNVQVQDNTFNFAIKFISLDFMRTLWWRLSYSINYVWRFFTICALSQHTQENNMIYLKEIRQFCSVTIAVVCFIKNIPDCLSVEHKQKSDAREKGNFHEKLKSEISNKKLNNQVFIIPYITILLIRPVLFSFSQIDSYYIWYLHDFKVNRFHGILRRD